MGLKSVAARRPFDKGNPARMTILEFLLLLLVAGVCGSIGQSISGYTRTGCLTSIALGFIGALLGLWIKRGLGLPELLPIAIGGQPFPVIWSIIGAALFVAIVGFLGRGGRRH